MKKFFRNENGSIMIETLLVLPLHLFLLFGVMWISSLSFNQLAFTQYSFTLQGSNANSSDIQSKLWGDDNFITTSFNNSSGDGNWWKQVSSGELTHKFPSYLEGLKVFSKIFTNLDNSIPSELQSNTTLNTFYYKNDSYGIDRTNIENAETLTWLNIAQESFPGDSTINSGNNAKIIVPYTSNQAFESWSKMNE